MSKYLIISLAATIGCSVAFSNTAYSKGAEQTSANTQSKSKRNNFIFMCNDFAKKIQNCEPYICQVALGEDTTVTQIQGKKEGRCVVTTTTGSPIGIKKKDNVKAYDL